tara:strand:- start:288 stop:1151 length:864 start_codon:yes stop_codon:yes gene_type:complete
MRTFSLQTPCAMNAAAFWDLKYDFDVESAVALAGGRVLTLHNEMAGTDTDGNETLTRIVGCTFASNPVPPALRKWIDGSKVDSEVDMHWRPKVWDEEHPCTTTIRLLHFSKYVSISSTQWLEERTSSACTVWARVCVECTAMGIGGLVEAAIEKDMRKALEAFPLRVIAYKNGVDESTPSQSQPLSPVQLMADRALPLPEKFRRQKLRSKPPWRWRERLHPMWQRRGPEKTRIAASDEEEPNGKPLLVRLVQLFVCGACGAGLDGSGSIASMERSEHLEHELDEVAE